MINIAREKFTQNHIGRSPKMISWVNRLYKEEGKKKLIIESTQFQFWRDKKPFQKDTHFQFNHNNSYKKKSISPTSYIPFPKKKKQTKKRKRKWNGIFLQNILDWNLNLVFYSNYIVYESPICMIILWQWRLSLSNELRLYFNCHYE